MALINCPECNKEISDKAAACPNCGCPQSEFTQQPEDTRSEIDKIADEIFWEKPDDSWRNAKKLSKMSGISFSDACEMVNRRRDQWKKDRKKGMYPDTQYCQGCGSKDIEPFENPGIITVGKHNAFGGGYIGMQAPSKMWMKCNTCSKKWRPKKKK